MAPRETENNAYAKFWGDKQRALWYVMVFLEWSIASLNSQRHFNNVTSHALIYGRHLVMRSKRCAMQNQGITLKQYYCGDKK